jgi:hypothetical protein
MMKRVVVTKRRTWWGWGSISSLESRPHKQWRHSSSVPHLSHQNNGMSLSVKNILLRISDITWWVVWRYRNLIKKMLYYEI